MLKIEHVHRSFGTKHVLRGVSFHVREGSMSGLIGPSGGGKSVLLKIIGKVDEPTSGLVKRPITGVNDLSLMFQEGALFDSLNVLDNVAFPLVQGRVPIMTLPLTLRKHVHEQAEEILGRVGLMKAAYKMPAQLSGGMRRRVSLARALVTRPRIVLLDDPTCGLDPVASSVIMDLIAELHHEYKPTLLMVSHDLRRLFPVVDTVYALFDGHIVFGGSVDHLINSRHDHLLRFVACRYDITKRTEESSPSV